jgi:hypothetical protein
MTHLSVTSAGDRTAPEDEPRINTNRYAWTLTANVGKGRNCTIMNGRMQVAKKLMIGKMLCNTMMHSSHQDICFVGFGVSAVVGEMMLGRR